MKAFILLPASGLALAIALAVASVRAQTGGLHLAQGLLAGEVTSNSALLQTRLTAVPGLAAGDVAGAPGTGRFEIATTADFSDAKITAWLDANPAGDFILKTQVDGLRPGTTYHYRVAYGPDRARTRQSEPARFKTLPAAAAAAPVNFILTSCLNYAFFHEGHQTKSGKDSKTAYKGADRMQGYPGLEPMIRLQPDFVIIDGDAVYYDHPVATRAKTQAELRRKWHEQYVMPRFVQLFARSATYWLKDDHDYRINDGDTTGDYEPSHALGIATFREQVPVVNPADPKAVTYRTHRMGRDLQLWFVEGRDYRSPNAMPDGPDKTIWGAEQKAWLQRTLKESDATFKILVSPTPLIGPDDASKKDNHVNERGFRHEGEAFLAWLKANGIPPGRFFIINGDRHWKYHSQHATGFEEFGCGALNRENSRLGRAPGDPGSTDPQSKVRQFYTDQPASGGFLRVALQPGGAGKPATLTFAQHDDAGKVLYQHVSQAR
ncbi:MAG: alkaline phosphatase D family protein [Opitutaceae bacterium]|nr:alkaline phosphatase D family protein [Opitutaceae bacterium]